MKYMFLLTGILFVLSAHGQRIDDLRTKEDVDSFFAQKVDSHRGAIFVPFRSETTGGPLPPPAADPTLLLQDSFIIADLDGNGSKDLLINHYGLLVTVSEAGDNKYRYSGWPGCFLLDLVHVPGIKEPLMVIRRVERRMLAETERFIDTFILRSGDLLEYNPQPDTIAIFSVDYEILCDYCGDMPAFSTSIQSDRSATLNALLVASMDTGIYRGTIDSATYTSLFQLMQYLDLKDLKGSYTGFASDQPWATLKVQYADGSVKQIIDDGLCGTLGLRTLHQQFEKLVTSQRWVKKDP